MGSWMMQLWLQALPDGELAAVSRCREGGKVLCEVREWAFSSYGFRKRELSV